MKTIKQLNEELSRIINENFMNEISMNEISNELKQKVIAGRKQQLADLKQQLSDHPITIAKNKKNSAKNRLDRFQAHKTYSSNKFLIGQINDIDFYVKYAPNERGLFIVEQNGKILKTERDSFRHIVNYEIGNVAEEFIPMLIQQNKIQKPEDLKVKLSEYSLDHLKSRCHIGYYREIEKQIPGIQKYIYTIEPDEEMEQTCQKLHHEFLGEAFNLHELNAKTMKNAENKLYQSYDQASDAYWNVNGDEDGSYKELNSKIAKLQNKLKDDEDNLAGKNAEKRSLKRATWIIPIFEKFDEGVKTLQNKFKDFTIKGERELAKNAYNIILDLPMNQYITSHVKYRMDSFEKKQNGSIRYYGHVYIAPNKEEPTKIPRMLKNILLSDAVLKDYKLQRSKSEDEIVNRVIDNFDGKLEKIQEFIINEMPEITAKMERSKNRKPTQAAEWVELFREKQQMGLDIQLKITRQGYQVVSHMGAWYPGEDYNPDADTDSMSGVSKNWKKAIDQAVKTCIEEDDLVDELLYVEDHFNDNEYAQYFLQQLQIIRENRGENNEL